MKHHLAIWLSAVTAITAGPLAAAEMPDELQAPPSQHLELSVHAKGMQIYECKQAKDDATRFEWSLKGPEATLFDGTGRQAGQHYVGPTWESVDGSKVVGELKAKDKGPDSSAIPWLLLSAKSATGHGVLSNVQWIQRVETHGGKAPAQGCSTRSWQVAGSLIRSNRGSPVVRAPAHLHLVSTMILDSNV